MGKVPAKRDVSDQQDHNLPVHGSGLGKPRQPRSIVGFGPERTKERRNERMSERNEMK